MTPPPIPSSILAECEQRMDSGEQPYVVNSAGRMAIAPEVMKTYNLQNGQNISDDMIIPILLSQFAALEAQIDLLRIMGDLKKG